MSTRIFVFTIVSAIVIIVGFPSNQAQAVVGTASFTGNTASFSGAITTAANQPVRPAFGPVTLQYKSGENSWSDGLIMREGDGNVGIGTGPGPSKLTVNGTIESTSGGFKLPDGITLTTSDSIPAKLVMYFNLDACPSGWTSIAGRTIVGLPSGAAVSGETVGSAFTSALENRTHTHDGPSHSHTYTDVVTHTHSIDPPATTSGNDSHTHTVDPPVTTTSDPGNHNHSLSLNQGAEGTQKFWGTVITVSDNISSSSNGAHTHSINVAAVTSGSDNTAHTHSTDVASFTSGSTGVATGTSATSGTGSTSTAATGDVIPYIQLSLCEKN